jgi:acyl carrier protein
MSSLRPVQPTTAALGGFTPETVRRLVADYLGVKIEHVVDEARFFHDLGADWLDCLELTIVIGDRIAGVEITDDEIDEIQTVGDLIRLSDPQSGRNRRNSCASPSVEPGDT